MSIIKPEANMDSETEFTDQNPNTVHKNSIISAFAGIRWQSHDCTFSDWYYLPDIHLNRDFLPPEITLKLRGMRPGSEVSHRFSAGELIEERLPDLQFTVARTQFQPPSGLKPLAPRYGRWYPWKFLENLNLPNDGRKYSFRITDIQGDRITIDKNHPLADKTIELSIKIEAIRATETDERKRCKDIPAIVTANGPGMQDCLANETDFFPDCPFQRFDEGNDAEFFKRPDFSPFWDTAALDQVAQLYRQLIPEKAQILDLMAGAHSPLQEAGIPQVQVTCAGLNKKEMAANNQCNKQFKLDVNRISGLAFGSNQFDTVLIHAAIEYVIQPRLLFAELKRVLKPAGMVIISFSNRSIPQKTIQIWASADEFERPAIILSYLRSTTGFTHFNSFSMRGLWRPETDKLADQLPFSDPVFAIWAEKK